MITILHCPAGKHAWTWNGKPISYRDKEGKDGTYVPRPTRRGACTCVACRLQPVPPHLPPNAGRGGREPSPWRENAVRALEDQA